MGKLRSLLSWWKDNIKEGSNMSTAMAHLLEHQYTNASLCYSGLRGHDKQVIAHLREACQELEVSLYLANLDVTIDDGCDKDDDDTDGYHEIVE